MLKKLEQEKQAHDIEIGLLQEEKYQFGVCITSLNQQQLTLKSELENRQQKILKLEDQLSVLQPKLNELKTQYEKLASDYIDKFSVFTDKHEEEIERIKNDFWKEKEKLLMENEMYKTRISNMETETNKMEETNCSVLKELKTLQIRHEEVGFYNYAISVLICVLWLCILCLCVYMNIHIIYY